MSLSNIKIAIQVDLASRCPIRVSRRSLNKYLIPNDFELIREKSIRKNSFRFLTRKQADLKLISLAVSRSKQRGKCDKKRKKFLEPSERITRNQAKIIQSYKKFSSPTLSKLVNAKPLQFRSVRPKTPVDSSESLTIVRCKRNAPSLPRLPILLKTNRNSDLDTDRMDSMLYIDYL